MAVACRAHQTHEALLSFSPQTYRRSNTGCGFVQLTTLFGLFCLVVVLPWPGLPCYTLLDTLFSVPRRLRLESSNRRRMFQTVPHSRPCPGARKNAALQVDATEDRVHNILTTHSCIFRCDT
ncbi:hypothetical protein CMEL01_06403 [Colletotrichum melonis]|uniref:Uncharacterized protein n=1 Tax=Colletotrichum melonis TaxID=1209925 RepID=A0AAI9U9B8_9PEZI|nr:hypothetical protein CMEL01_06403 [Colletotrichum melonis]